MVSTATASIGVREAYELWAPKYAQGASPLLALQERTLEPLIPPVRGRRVVDIACGTGRWLKRLAARGPSYAIGLDLSLPMLRRAHFEIESPKHLLCADGCALPLRDRCADLVFCSLALDHVANLAAFIADVARITDDHGMLILSDFHPDAHARGWKRNFKSDAQTIELPVYPRHLSTLHNALRHAGFRLERCNEPAFGNPDRWAFEQAGRGDLFTAAAKAGPAIYAARYVRVRRRQIAVSRYDFRIEGATVARSGNAAARGSISVSDGLFSAIDAPDVAAANTVDLTGYLILPGLVNAHEHLEFSLFPRLGRRPYANASDWAADIHRPDESPIREHRAVPKDVRLWWGGLKNLLCGVTTVCHHNPYSEVFADPSFPIRVVERYGWAHSFAADPNVQGYFQTTPTGAPFFIHLGEGTDHDAGREFHNLVEIGGVDDRTVVVHGVALSRDEHRHLQERGGAVAWCPSSNLFLLGRTLSTETLMSASRVALGSDSSISGAGDFLDEIAIAARYVSPERVYEFATNLAANVVQDGAGSISAGLPADFIVFRDQKLSPANMLVNCTCSDIQLVVVAGRLRLISPELLDRWPGPLPPWFERIVLEGVTRYVAAPVARLVEEARRHLGPEIRLAGRRVWQ